MKILGIIPARFASTRFPGKPLVDIHGKSMIRRVYEQAKKSEKLDDVIVATDDERILSHVLAFGGKGLLTSEKHESGTDRCAEVMQKIIGFDVAVNIQGDEPYIDPRQIDLLCSCFASDDISIATLIKEIRSTDELFNANSPKVLINVLNEAIYFSRTPVPYQRNQPEGDWLNHHKYFKHIGIYGYRKDTLVALTNLPVSSLEKAEALEQLRWIENGYKIKTALTSIETVAIDTPEDLLKLPADL
ncbi:3-deoxy-manno-octulosonate cytidylyltransferase [Pedobacter sp. HMF7647]|uniref:3-deoxy-manno-octulosonate cytidylyltransferase n=1 Tax=Hufsiella arboris TaxID=2695275 RepID=A0A7K1YC82_9SPHI|nr:3-deoxy-manno-octulosonate cytidylyltransferase [Hufsiella arboris]MXV52196.1 3-deoxy-manno-octulosonate cytidylyltransferase [Hufsiella arboris]